MKDEMEDQGPGASAILGEGVFMLEPLDVSLVPPGVHWWANGCTRMGTRVYTGGHMGVG